MLPLGETRTRAYTYTDTDIYTRTHKDTHAHTHAHTYTHTYTHTDTDTDTDTHKFIHKRVHVYTHYRKRTEACICLRFCMRGVLVCTLHVVHLVGLFSVLAKEF